MSVTYDVAGRLSVTVDGADDEMLKSFGRLMDPCVPREWVSRAAGVTVQCGVQIPDCDELVNPARDGVTTAAAGNEHVLLGGGAVVLPRHDQGHVTVGLSPGTSPGSVIRTVIRPALQVAALEAGAVCVHGACVEIDGSAIVVAGWSETGKTEVALGLMELGARFVSDKWTVVGDDVTAATFPISVGVRRWVLPSLPTLRAALPGGARAQMRAAAVGRWMTAPVRHLPGRIGGAVGGLVTRAVGLADRVALTPSEIAQAYGHSLDASTVRPLGGVVLLTTVPEGEVAIDEVDPAWVARRLARTAQFERREYYELYERGRYVDVRGDLLRAQVEQREEEFLARALSGVRLLRVRIPFPADPRPAAAAIGERVAG